MRMWVSIILSLFVFWPIIGLDLYYEQEDASTFTLYKIAIGPLNCYISISLHLVLGLTTESSYSPLTQEGSFLLHRQHRLTNQCSLLRFL